MGGAVNVGGNVMENPVAEWNYYVDPVSVEHVFNSGLPITLVPLDATNQVPVKLEAISHLADGPDTPGAKLSRRMLEAQRSEIANNTLHFWDTLTAVISADAATAKTKEMKIQVDTNTGQTRQAEGGVPMQVATEVDAPRFYQIFFQTLGGQFK
jgi:inosine-uridine nucleoside N-ribohydrolase